MSAITVIPGGEHTAIGGRRYSRIRGQVWIVERTGSNRSLAFPEDNRGIAEPAYAGDANYF